MLVGHVFLAGLSLALSAQSPAPPTPPPSGCAQVVADAVTDGAAGEYALVMKAFG